MFICKCAQYISKDDNLAQISKAEHLTMYSVDVLEVNFLTSKGKRR